MKAGIEEVVAAVRAAAGAEPFALAVVLGSGLGELAAVVEPAAVLSCRDFSCFPPSSVAGHAGRILAGTLDGRRVLLFQGRQHLYEGHDARQVALPVRIAHALGAPRLLLTNAAGGINEAFRPGDFMVVTDHLNFLGDNPLRGERRDPFVDLTGLYAQGFFPALAEFARPQGIGLHRGVLAAMPGPSYETPAEIRALRLLGADAVSMSTIPEAIMARYLGLEVAALSLIANAAAGLAPSPLDHGEVLAAGRRAGSDFVRLVRRLLALWLPSPSS